MQRRKHWWEDAACNGVGVSIFFPEIKRGDCHGRLVALYAPAKEYCDRCPVKVPCLETQLKEEMLTYQHDGMFGGMTPQERKRLVAEREWEQRKAR